MSDHKLFKFKRIDKYLLTSLVQSEIYFAHPEELNDPLDCRVNIVSALEDAISRAPPALREKLERIRGLNVPLKAIQNRVAKIGVCSFSRELRNTLMWAHYADGHCGICLTYCFSEAFFVDNQADLLGVSEVDYFENALSKWFLESALGLLETETPDKPFFNFGEALVKKALTVKATPWSYEKEVRIISRTKGVYPLEKSQLKQVCFGLGAC